MWIIYTVACIAAIYFMPNLMVIIYTRNSEKSNDVNMKNMNYQQGKTYILKNKRAQKNSLKSDILAFIRKSLIISLLIAIVVIIMMVICNISLSIKSFLDIWGCFDIAAILLLLLYSKKPKFDISYAKQILQKKYIKEHMNYIINNLDGIKNQKDEYYKVSCSMEGHVNQAFARYITSSPYGFSKQGLENKLKLLVYHANKHELTIEDYYNLKYGNNNYEEINIKIKKLCNIKYDQKLTSNHSLEYKVNTSIPIFDSPSENNKLKELTSIRQEIYVI